MKHFFVSVAFLLLGYCSFAQKIKLTEGSLAALRDEKEINTEFTYDGMSVGKYKDEAEYVAKKTEEYNKKEAGRGDNWAKNWVLDRKDKFEPKFNELFEQEIVLHLPAGGNRLDQLDLPGSQAIEDLFHIGSLHARFEVVE